MHRSVKLKHRHLQQSGLHRRPPGEPDPQEVTPVSGAVSSNKACHDTNKDERRADPYRSSSPVRESGPLTTHDSGETVHGSSNVPIEHHPTIRYMVYNGYYKVMSNIAKMGQLPTPAVEISILASPMPSPAVLLMPIRLIAAQIPLRMKILHIWTCMNFSYANGLPLVE